VVDRYQCFRKTAIFLIFWVVVTSALKIKALYYWETLVKLIIKQSVFRPISGDGSSQISRKLAHECSKVVSPSHRPPLSLKEYSWYSFLLGAESTPGPKCGRKDYVNEKF
jgi:hypothetical protein